MGLPTGGVMLQDANPASSSDMATPSSRGADEHCGGGQSSSSGRLTMPPQPGQMVTCAWIVIRRPQKPQAETSGSSIIEISPE